MDESARLLALINELTDWFEFKVSNHSPDEIAKRVCGLSNAATLADKRYAYIVWGVRDADHVVVVCCP